MSLDAIFSHKSKIDAHIAHYLDSKKKTFGDVSPLGEGVLEKLSTFATSGKTVRGSLVLFSFTQSTQNKPDTLVYDVAAAVELVHSAFLIHDDIMDRDDLRRGKPSIHRQFAQDPGVGLDHHYGISQGINAADLCLFMGMELFARSLAHHPSVHAYLSREYQTVVLGQMTDVYGSTGTVTFSDKEILSVYRNKTARYTFSVPLSLGAMLAGADTHTTQMLEKLGEHTGLIYQLHDDELNASGDRMLSGKPTGSDLREHKQTYLAWLATNRSPVSYTSVLAEHKAIAYDLVDTLPYGQATQKILRDLIDFCMTRSA